MDEEPTLSKRARRAVPLIASAVTVIFAVGILFLRANAPSSTVTPSPTIPRLSATYAVAYDFVSPSVGWAAVTDQNLSRFWIFKTTDGATHWLRQFEAQSWLGRNYIHFFDTVHGVAYGAQLYRTADGGAHWQLVNSPGPGPSFAFASPTRGWEAVFTGADDAGHLYSTADGGSTWAQMQAPLPPSAAIWPFANSQSFDFRVTGEGWLGFVGPQPIVYMTADAGARWQAINLPVPTNTYAAYFTAVRLIPGGGVLVAVGSNFGPLAVFVSVDQGHSWREVKIPRPSAAWAAASFVDSTHWWASGSRLLYKTDDAGLTWRGISMAGLPDDWNDQPARVIDAKHGWLPMISMAGSSDSALAMTSDGGLHWTPVNVPRPG